MKKIVLLAILLAGILACPPAVFSVEDILPASEEAVEEVSGTIVAIEEQEQYIVVQYPVEEEAGVIETAIFNLSDHSRIVKGGQAAALSELKSEDKVVIQYQMDADDNRIINSLSTVN